MDSAIHIVAVIVILGILAPFAMAIAGVVAARYSSPDESSGQARDTSRSEGH